MKNCTSTAVNPQGIFLLLVPMVWFWIPWNLDVWFLFLNGDFLKWGYPNMENPIKMDDLGVPPFQETSKSLSWDSISCEQKSHWYKNQWRIYQPSNRFEPMSHVLGLRGFNARINCTCGFLRRGQLKLKKRGYGGTPRILVCKGKSHRSKWMITRGTPISGNHHLMRISSIDRHSMG